MLSADEYRELAASGVTGMVDAGGSTNWLDEVLQTPFNQTYNISLKGGTKNTNYVASADYTSNEGIFVAQTSTCFIQDSISPIVCGIIC